MKIRLDKIFRLKKRQLITLLALFFAAILLGFIGEKNKAETSDSLSREALFAETSIILHRLEPVLNRIESKKQTLFPHVNLKENKQLIFEKGLAKCFPDGTFKQEQNLRRGEVLFFLRNLVDFILSKLKYKQIVITGPVYFEDIFKGHWLEESVQILEGIGALNDLRNLRLFPDKKMKISELKVISSGIVSYFSSNLLMIYRERNNLKIVLKGALKALDTNDCQVSFNGNSWFRVPENGIIPLPDQKQEEICLNFDHPLFLPTGAIELRKANVLYVKLNRDFIQMTRSGFENVAKNEVYKEKGDIKRVKKRIEELKKKYSLVKNNNAGEKDCNVDFSEIIYSGNENQTNKNLSFKSHLNKSNHFDNSEKKENLIQNNKTENQFLLEGIIVDGITNKIIDNAMVIIDGESLKMQKNGTFCYETEKDKILEITVYCEGYSVFRMKHRAGFRMGELKLRLKPELATLSGNVLCSITKKPVSQALIKIGDKTTRTDDWGGFRLRGLKTGYNQISCYSEGFFEAHEIVVVEKSQSKQFIFELNPIDDF